MEIYHNLQWSGTRFLLEIHIIKGIRTTALKLSHTLRKIFQKHYNHWTLPIYNENIKENLEKKTSGSRQIIAQHKQCSIPIWLFKHGVMLCPHCITLTTHHWPNVRLMLGQRSIRLNHIIFKLKSKFFSDNKIAIDLYNSPIKLVKIMLLGPLWK